MQRKNSESTSKVSRITALMWWQSSKLKEPKLCQNV